MGRNQARILLGALSVAVIVPVIALAVSMADGMDGDHHGDGDTYHGMMGAMGDMHSEGMMGQMQDMMDEEMLPQMQQHMANHESMPMTGDMDIDQMMDGMMDHLMPDADRHGRHHRDSTASPQ